MKKHAKSKTSRRLKSGGKRQPSLKASRSSHGKNPASGSKDSKARAISNGSMLEMNFVDPDRLLFHQNINAISIQLRFDVDRLVAINENRAASCRIPRP